MSDVKRIDHLTLLKSRVDGGYGLLRIVRITLGYSERLLAGGAAIAPSAHGASFRRALDRA
jgi:hypothetical protein